MPHATCSLLDTLCSVHALHSSLWTACSVILTVSNNRTMARGCCWGLGCCPRGSGATPGAQGNAPGAWGSDADAGAQGLLLGLRRCRRGNARCVCGGVPPEKLARPSAWRPLVARRAVGDTASSRRLGGRRAGSWRLGERSATGRVHQERRGTQKKRPAARMQNASIQRASSPTLCHLHWLLGSYELVILRMFVAE